MNHNMSLHTVLQCEEALTTKTSLFIRVVATVVFSIALISLSYTLAIVAGKFIVLAYH